MLFSLIKTVSTVSTGTEWRIRLPGQPEPTPLELVWTVMGRRRRKGGSWAGKKKLR